MKPCNVLMFTGVNFLSFSCHYMLQLFYNLPIENFVYLNWSRLAASFYHNPTSSWGLSMIVFSWAMKKTLAVRVTENFSLDFAFLMMVAFIFHRFPENLSPRRHVIYDVMRPNQQKTQFAKIKN